MRGVCPGGLSCPTAVCRACTTSTATPPRNKIWPSCGRVRREGGCRCAVCWLHMCRERKASAGELSLLRGVPYVEDCRGGGEERADVGIFFRADRLAGSRSAFWFLQVGYVCAQGGRTADGGWIESCQCDVDSASLQLRPPALEMHAAQLGSASAAASSGRAVPWVTGHGL